MSDSEIDSLLGSIKGLKLKQNIEFELDKKIDEFIKMVFPDSKDPYNTTDEKLDFLKKQNPVDRSKIEKDKLKDFLTGYHTELASVISNAPPVVASQSGAPSEVNPPRVARSGAPVVKPPTVTKSPDPSGAPVVAPPLVAPSDAKNVAPLPAPPSGAQVIALPPPITVQPTTTVVAPPPAAPAADAAAAAVSEKPDEFGSFDGTFHETQQNAGCGRHALNNLLGGTFFTSPTTEDAFKNTNPYTLVELKTAIGILNTSDPLDLQKLCKCLNDIYPVKYCPSVDNGINCCQVAENYDQMVLRTALELIGFDVVPGGQGAVFGSDAKKFNSRDLDENITGILINPGGHWTSARKHNGKIYYMNSINTNPQESQSSNKIITTYELNNILTDTIVLVVGPYIANSGKKDFIRLKIESIAKDVTDDNITIAGESGARSIRSLIYDDLPLIIDDITDVKLINILYENEIYIKAPYTDLANYIVLFRTHTDKTKMQADLVKLLTTP